MLELTIDGRNVHVKGTEDKEEMITDSVYAVLALVQHLSESLNISHDVAFARLYTVSAFALDECRVDMRATETVKFADIEDIIKKKREQEE